MKNFFKSLLAVFWAGTTSSATTGNATAQAEPPIIPDKAPAEFEGEWVLYAYAHLNSDLLGDKDEVDANDIQKWLLGAGSDLVGQQETMTGSILKISQSGYISETAGSRAKVHWFDEEGVLENYDVISPYKGILVENDYGMFTRPESIASWAVPDQNAYQALLRYDDYDTQISERIDVENLELVRTLNAVTDGVYVDRIVMYYRKSGES